MKIVTFLHESFIQCIWFHLIKDSLQLNDTQLELYFLP